MLGNRARASSRIRFRITFDELAADLSDRAANTDSTSAQVDILDIGSGEIAKSKPGGSEEQDDVTRRRHGIHPLLYRLLINLSGRPRAELRLDTKSPAVFLSAADFRAQLGA